MRKIDFIVLTFFSIVALTTMQGCKKKEDKIEAPKLTFKALSSKSLLQFKDSLTVTFSYEDNDGDIGFYDADSSSVYIQDKRLTHPDLYYLKPLNPPNLKPRIKGDVQLGLRNMFLLFWTKY